MNYNIPLTGFAVIILALIVLFVDLEYAFLATLALIPFSAMAIANFQMQGHWVALTPPFFFSALSVVKFAIVRRQQLTDRLLQLKPIGLLAGAATLAVIISWILPILKMKSEPVCTPLPNQDVFCPGSFGFRNVVQYAYFILWILFAWTFAAELDSQRKFSRAIKTLLASSFFVGLWSFVQIAAYYFDFHYPSEIFNTSLSPYAQGFTGTYGDIFFKRSSSVSVEPSIYAQYLIFVLPIFLLPQIEGESRAILRLRQVGALVMVASLAGSGTRTAFLGWLILVGFYALAFILTRLKSHLSALALLIAGVIAYAAINPNFVTFARFYFLPLFASLFTKSQAPIIAKTDYSAMERGLSMKEALTVWLKSPIAGVGWRNVTSHDLVLNVLANTGILGGLLIVGALIFLTYKLILPAWKAKCENRTNAFFLQAFALTTVSLLVIQQITGFSFIYGSFWVSIALGFAAYSQRKNECVS